MARMMAKKPKERYQRPEELVSHLLVLAQKLGSGNQGADSVLFVDAPLPGQPRTRPMLRQNGALLHGTFADGDDHLVHADRARRERSTVEHEVRHATE